MCGVPDLSRCPGFVAASRICLSKNVAHSLQGHVAPHRPTSANSLTPGGLPPGGSTENGLWDSLSHSFSLSLFYLSVSFYRAFPLSFLPLCLLSLSRSLFLSCFMCLFYCFRSLSLSLSLSLSSLSLSFIVSRTLFHFISFVCSLSPSSSVKREKQES